MRLFRFAQAVLALLIAVNGPAAADALADGKLSYSLEAPGRMARVEITEEAGIQKGFEFLMPGGASELSSESREKELIITVGQDIFRLTASRSPALTEYHGAVWGVPATLTARTRNESTFINGRVGNANVEVRMDSKRGRFTMRWTEVELAFERKRGGAPGECRGRASQQFQPVAEFFCESSGSLEDAFFKNPDTVISWLVTLLVNPNG